MALILFLLTFTQETHAASGITYTGRILKGDTPVDSGIIVFDVWVRSSNNCDLYYEQRSIDMTGSGGTYSFEVGSAGSVTSVWGSGYTALSELFDNTKVTASGLTGGSPCTGSFTPTALEGRKMLVSFTPPSEAAQALPELTLTAVPTALQAFNANKVNGYDQNHLLRIDPTITSPVNSDLDAVKLAEFFRLVNNPNAAYLTAIPTLGGDVSGTLPAMSVDKIKGYAVATPAGAGDNGKVLTFNSVTGWSLQAGSGASTDSSYVAKGVVQFDTSVAVSGITVAAGVAKVNTGTGANQIVQLDGAAKLPAVDGSQLTAVVVPDSSITSTKILDGTIVNADISGTAAIAWAKIASPTTLAGYGITDAVNKTGDTMSGALAMGAQNITNTGNITMAASKYLGLSANTTDGTVAGQMWYDTGIIKYFDGTTVKSLGVAGAGITNLNGLTGASQTFAIGTSGTAPAFNSVTSTHTLNIPMASTAAVTAGLLSKADYDTFNAKLGAVTNTATLAPTKIWIGDVGSKAQEFALSGDATMTSGGVVTVDKTQAAAASKILQLTASSVAVTKGEDIGGASTGKVSLRYPSTATDTTLTFPSSAGSASQFLQTDGSGNLTWAAPAASLPGLTSTQVWVGNASGVAAPVALSGDITSITNAGVVTATKTTTAEANKILSLDGSSVATAAGVALVNTGTVTLSAQTASSTYGLKWPAAAPAASQSLQSDASGNLTWVSGLTSNTGWAKNGNAFGAKATVGNTDNYDLGFITNNTEKMTILNSGNVGIGTIAPSSNLSVTPLQYNTGTASQATTTVTGAGTTWTAAMVGSQFVFANGVSAGKITAFNSATSLTVTASQTVTSQAYAIGYTGLQVNSTGKVGIGTTSPSAALTVETKDISAGGSNLYSLYNVNPTANSGGSFTALDGYVSMSGTSNIDSLYGVYGNAEHTGSGTVTNLVGGSFRAYPFNTKPVTNSYGIEASGYGWGTTTNIAGAKVNAENYGSGATSLAGMDMFVQTGGSVTDVYGTKSDVQANAGTIANMYGSRIQMSQGGGVGVTNFYGLYLDPITHLAAPTLKYAIYQAGPNDKNYFAGKVGIGIATPTTGTSLDITGTGAAASSIIIPRDTVANRPTAGVNGMIRYASDTDKFEAYQNGAWVNMVSSTSGTVTSVSGTAPISVATGTSTPVISITDGTSTGQALRWNGSAWASGFIAMTDLRSTVTGANSFATTCASNQTLTYNSVGDVMSCANIAIANTQVSGLGILSTKSAADLTADVSGVLPVANGGTGTATGSITGTGALSFAAGGAAQDVTLTPSTTGKVNLGSVAGTVVHLPDGGTIVSGTTACGAVGDLIRDSAGDLYVCK